MRKFLCTGALAQDTCAHGPPTSRKKEEKVHFPLAQQSTAFLPNQSANFDRAFFSTLGNKMVHDVGQQVGRLARLRG
jgi:hypothetical protein